MLAGNEGGNTPASQGPPAAAWPEVVWPELTRAEAEARQAEVDDGSRAYDWQLDPLQLAARFGEDSRLWEQSIILGPSVDLTEYPVKVTITNCPTPVPESMGGACEEAALTLEQPLGRGQGMLWFVTADELPTAGPGNDPSGEEADAEGFTSDFMDARLAGSGAEGPFLTQDSQGLYQTHTGGLYLYDGDVSGGEPQTSYASYEIRSVNPHQDPDPRSAVGHDVVVAIITGEFEGQSRTIVEQLWVASGLRLDNSRGLVVRTAERLGDPGGEPTTQCQQGSPTPVQSCARMFMQSRLDGAGAEWSMTEDARSVYDDTSNQLHLYGTPYQDSGNFSFDRYEILGVRKADANSYEVDVRLYVAAEGGPMTIFETLLIGPGRNANDQLQDFVVRGAEGRYE